MFWIGGRLMGGHLLEVIAEGGLTVLETITMLMLLKY